MQGAASQQAPSSLRPQSSWGVRPDHPYPPASSSAGFAPSHPSPHSPLGSGRSDLPVMGMQGSIHAASPGLSEHGAQHAHRSPEQFGDGRSFAVPYPPASNARGSLQGPSLYLERSTSFDRRSLVQDANNHDNSPRTSSAHEAQHQSSAQVRSSVLPPSAPLPRYPAQATDTLASGAGPPDLFNGPGAVIPLEVDPLWEDWPIQSAVMGAQGGLSVFVRRTTCRDEE